MLLKEEMVMRRLVMTLICLSLAFTGMHRVSVAEEELFDTEAATVYLEKGISFLKAKNYKAAVNEFEEAVSIAPDAENYYYLGYTYYLIGRSGDSESRKKSIECFDKAYELNPNFTPSRYATAETMPAKAPQRESEMQQPAAVTPASPQPPAAEAEQPAKSVSPEQLQKQ